MSADDKFEKCLKKNNSSPTLSWEISNMFSSKYGVCTKNGILYVAL